MECSIGVSIEEVCHRLSYCRSSVLHKISDFSEEQKSLLSLRTGCDDLTTICTFHKVQYLEKYFCMYGKSCCNPFGSHSKLIKKSLCEITLKLSVANPELKLIPGRALCNKCLDKIQPSQKDIARFIKKAQIKRKADMQRPKYKDYICCVYDDKWWLGEVVEVQAQENEEEYRVHFFHPHGPGTSFKKSAGDYETWVQQRNILMILSPSELYTATGRGYNVTSKMSEQLSKLHNIKKAKC